VTQTLAHSRSTQSHNGVENFGTGTLALRGQHEPDLESVDRE